MLNKNTSPETTVITDENNTTLEYSSNATVLKANAETSEKLSMNYVLEQIENIANDKQYLYDTIDKLGEMANANGPGDIVGQAKAEALSNVVQCRETTNQQLLKMYEKMYDDLKGINSIGLSGEILQLKQVCEIIRETQSEAEANKTIRTITQQMFVKPGAEIV